MGGGPQGGPIWVFPIKETGGGPRDGGGSDMGVLIGETPVELPSNGVPNNRVLNWGLQ